MILSLVLIFTVLVSVSMPVAFAIGIACAASIVLFSDIPLAAIPHKMVNGIDSYVFLAIPLFLLAGRLMNAGGITDRLFRFARVWVGAIHGGLAHANVVAGMLFAWMSGSAVAAVGGHATLVRAPAAVRAKMDVFWRADAALAALTKRVKESFDPKSVLNPGRMWAGV